MFTLANRIAYDGRMVFAIPDGSSPIRDPLGPSAWIDVDAPSTDKWVETEGLLIAAALSQLCRALPQAPDIYVICPFRVPAARLRAMLLGTPGVVPGLSRAERRDWIERRVGTVHTFQGKEAEAVILILGAGWGAKAGSRSWAGATPNLLNVAATRAKRVLYVAGNRTEWQSAGVFAVAADMLEPRSPREWLRAGPAGIGTVAALPYPVPHKSSSDRRPPVEALAGLVERVAFFHNPDTSFCVLRIKARGQRDLVTVVGHAASIASGELPGSQRDGGSASERQSDRPHGAGDPRASRLSGRSPTTSPSTSKLSDGKHHSKPSAR